MGGVVPTPRRAGNPAPRADASRTVDVGRRRRSSRPLLNRAPVRRRSPAASSRPLELAGFPGGWRATIARRVGRATRSKRSSTRWTSAVPIPQRARRTRSHPTPSTAPYCRATSATNRTTHIASVVRHSPSPTEGFHERAREALPLRDATLDLHGLEVVAGATQSLMTYGAGASQADPSDN